MKQLARIGALTAAVAVCLGAGSTVRAADEARTPVAAWNSVTLGFPAASLRLNIGDPLRVLQAPDGSTRVARYWVPGSFNTFFLVIERRGYIAGFHAFTTVDPKAVIANVPPDPSPMR